MSSRLQRKSAPRALDAGATAQEVGTPMQRAEYTGTDSTAFAKLREIVRLHDEAFDHAMQEDGHHKSSEGQITVHFTNRFDDERESDPLHIKAVEVYSYVLGPSRNHHFATVDEALAAMRKWHHSEMTCEDTA